MKWIFKRALLAAPVIMFYSFFCLNACLLTGCGSPAKPPVLHLSAQSSTDSTGPRVTIHTSGQIPAGSSLVLSCTTPGCKITLSTDSTGGHGGVRIVSLGTFTEDVPDNTEFELKVIAKGDPAMVK